MKAVINALDAFDPLGEAERRDTECLRALAGAQPDPWARSLPLHLTASALVVEPRGGRVLLRWHEHQRLWLQVGGHGDPGESDPFAISMREAREETGLSDLTPLKSGLVHVAVVPVLAARGEPAHRHGDLRFVFATSRPEEAVAENDIARLRWLGWDDALAMADDPHLARFIERARELVEPVTLS